MLLKCVKIGVITVVGCAVVGGLLFGSDLVSYVRSSAASVRSALKDSVPIEFELERARNKLEQIVPELQANIRMIATEEVEVAALKDGIARGETAMSDQKVRIEKLTGLLGTEEVSYTIGERQYPRQSVKAELARRFDRYKEVEVVLEGKRRLLGARERSLQAAISMLEKARQQKVLLEDRIETLVSQHRMIQAASVGSRIQVDNSKLAQTEKLIAQIKKRLDVAERVLAHEGRFVETIEVDAINEKDLLVQIQEHFSRTDGRRLAAAGGPEGSMLAAGER